MTGSAADLPTFIGRARELDRLRSALPTAREGGRVVVVGEPGIGKTSLLRQVVSEASATLVWLTGAEPEADLPYSSVGLLARSLLALEPPLSAGHESLLSGLVAHADVELHSLSVGAAILAALASLAATHPLQLVLDDAQWFDPESVTAIGFALRRCVDEPIGVIIATRPEGAGIFDSLDLTTLTLAGLDVEDTLRLFARSGSEITAEVAAECVDATGGNPLALLEVHHLLSPEQRSGIRPLPSVLPLHRGLVSLLRERVALLSSAARDLAALVAASGEGDQYALSAATSAASLGVDAVAELEHHRLVSVLDGSMTLAHPLIRSAIAAELGAAAMRAAHGELATALVDQPERRSWHLAAAAVGPDAGVADELDDIGKAAAARGSTHAAGVAFERAALLSPSEHDAHQRRIAAGWAWARASKYRRAISVVQPVIGHTHDRLIRADAAIILGDVLGWTDTDRGLALLLEHGAAVEPLDPARAATAYLLASQHNGLAARNAESLRLAERSVQLATESGSAVAIAALSIRAMARQRNCQRDDADADLAIASVLVGLPPELLPVMGVPVLTSISLTQLLQERWADMRVSLNYTQQRSRTHGLLSTLQFTGALRGELLLRTGRLIEATVAPVDDTLLFDTSEEVTPSWGHAVLARVEATLGWREQAIEHAHAAIARSDANGMILLGMFARSALGHLALLDDDPEGALAALRLVHGAYEGRVDPGELWYQGDLVEALAAMGEFDEARTVVATVEANAAAARSKWGTAVALRGRGLLERDADALRQSVEVLGDLGAPFERARSLALLGAMTADRAATEDAIHDFVQCGATAWARRTRAHAGGGARPHHSTRVPAQGVRRDDLVAPALNLLSPAELRVAVALAGGMSNREIADELYLSTRTVESHLSTVYRKLGLRRRSELVALLSRQLG